jgi:hypothetical protein
MWDPVEYTKRVLSPAVDAFKAEGRLPDVFERYGLCSDVSSAADIESAIKTVTAFWNKTKLQNAKYKQLLEVLLAPREQQEARRILLDPEARALQRRVVEAERVSRRDARFAELDRSIGILAAKGYLTPKEKSLLIARCVPTGLTEAEIDARVRVPVKEPAAPIPRNEGVPRIVRDQIRANLGVLKHRDLYEFLGVQPEGLRGTSPSSIRARIAEAHRVRELEWRQRPADFRTAAANTLLGVVKTLLAGDPANFEAARAWGIVDQLRPEVELAAVDRRITREAFKNLVELAVSLGLEASAASDYVFALAKDFDAAVEWAPVGESVRCGYCSSMLVQRPGLERCAVCGHELWTKCPKCNTRGLVSEAACRKCGFAVANLPRVQLALRRARLALAEGLLAEAVEAAREAESLWGRHGDVAGLLDQIEARLRSLAEADREIEQAIVSKQLVCASRKVQSLSVEMPDYRLRSGKTVREVAVEVAAQLKHVTVLVDRGRALERKAQWNEAAAVYQEALDIAADAEEPRAGLRRCPPAPPENVRATVHEKYVLVEWSPTGAAGAPVEYRVARSEGHAPASADDGAVVGRTVACFIKDESVRPGSFTFYGVVAERGGAASAVAAAPGLMITREVDRLEIVPGNESVQGTWELPVPTARVRVFRREGTAPKGPGDGIEVRLASPNSFLDTGVRNGCLYYFRVCVEYQMPSGVPVLTTGHVVSLRPDRVPTAVEDLQIQSEENSLLLTWSQPLRGSVAIYRLSQEPEWECGTRVPASQLSRFGAPLSPKGAAAVIDPSPPPLRTYYLPVTVAGDLAVIGAARPYVSLPEVSHIEANDFGHYLQLTWVWPENCHVALVAWRADAYPERPTDRRATKRKITKGEYERVGGFRVEQPEASPYRFVVFAAVEAGGDEDYSAGVHPGARAELRTVSPATVRYTLSRSRFRPSRLTITLHADRTVAVLPEIVVVGRRGDLQPLRVEDGAVLVRLTGLSLTPEEPVSTTFALDTVTPPAYVRAFVMDPAATELIRLIDPLPAQLRIG